MTKRTDPARLWQAIVQAGGIDAYVNAQLKEHGFLVERRETDDMSKRQLNEYKKSLKAEAAEKKRLKKEAWKAYKENNIVHVGEGIYWNDHDNFDKWDLENAEERAAENELPPLDSPKQLAEALGIAVTKLRWLAYHREAATRVHYYRFTIAKRDGSERPIWAPLPDLKAAQRWILHNIAEKLPVHGSAHGFLPSRSILTNANVHVNSGMVVQMDIRNFFPTVTYPRVKGIFRKAGYREQIATLLALLCTEAPREIVEHDGTSYYVAMGPRCLPQGAPTSPALTNTLCLGLDQRISGLVKKYGWRYTRYADDLTFSLPKKQMKKAAPGTLVGLVSKIIEDEGFAVHKKKTRTARIGGQQKVTGLVVNDDLTPRVPRKIKRRLRAAIHNVKNGKPLIDGDTPERLAGYAAYIFMSEPELGRELFEA
ncbi:MAG: RNA-directed DNA polymerase, partial [bacterium]|nr:RNA-directed DNA polymerase [bacterium]